MPIYALCDANNFYCSCERVFNPRPEHLSPRYTTRLDELVRVVA